MSSRPTPLQRIPELRTSGEKRIGRSSSVNDQIPALLGHLFLGLRAQSHVTWSLFTAQLQSPPERAGSGWLKSVCCYSLFFLSSIPSSHLDPVGTHSTLQGSGATTPEHPSVIDPLMEQDEGPSTPPAKQSTPSSRSANAFCEPSTCVLGERGGPGRALSWPEYIL